MPQSDAARPSPVVTNKKKTLFESALGKMLGLNELIGINQRCSPASSHQEYLARAFTEIGVSYTFDQAQLSHIPKTGACVVVVNHPLGAIDGMIIADLVTKARPDVRIIANYFLKNIDSLTHLFLAVDPFGGKGAAARSTSALREALSWVKQEHCLVVFASGKVAHRGWRRFRITEAPWLNTASKIILNTQADVVPIHITGQNGFWFNAAGFIHPKLRTITIPREVLNKRGQTFTATIGKPMRFTWLARITTVQQLTEYLRLKTLCLNPLAHDRGYLLKSIQKWRAKR